MSVSGADATRPATPTLISLAGRLLSKEPQFGRYFKVLIILVRFNSSPTLRTPVLHAVGIRVLCIARQTYRVEGTNQDGVADAVAAAWRPF
jgi:hypothetical protein